MSGGAAQRQPGARLAALVAEHPGNKRLLMIQIPQVILDSFNRDIALKREAIFGHMVPKYALEQLTPELLRSALERSGARAIYLHRKGMPKSAVTRWRDWAGKNSIAIVSSKELPQREK